MSERLTDEDLKAIEVRESFTTSAVGWEQIRRRELLALVSELRERRAAEQPPTPPAGRGEPMSDPVSAERIAEIHVRWDDYCAAASERQRVAALKNYELQRVQFQVFWAALIATADDVGPLLAAVDSRDEVIEVLVKAITSIPYGCRGTSADAALASYRSHFPAPDVKPEGPKG